MSLPENKHLRGFYRGCMARYAVGTRKRVSVPRTWAHTLYSTPVCWEQQIKRYSLKRWGFHSPHRLDGAHGGRSPRDEAGNACVMAGRGHDRAGCRRLTTNGEPISVGWVARWSRLTSPTLGRAV